MTEFCNVVCGDTGRVVWTASGRTLEEAQHRAEVIARGMAFGGRPYAAAKAGVPVEPTREARVETVWQRALLDDANVALRGLLALLYPGWTDEAIREEAPDAWPAIQAARAVLARMEG